MNISKKDINLLIILGAILIGILYYQFGYGILNDKLDARKKAKVEIETRYNKVMSDIDTLEERKSNVKELTTKVTEKSAGFYPEIIQQKFITEIDKLIEASGIKANLQFGDIEVKAVEDLTPKTTTLPATSLDALASVFKGESTEKVAENSTTKTTTNTKTTTKTTTNDTITCKQAKLTINLTSGTYEQVKKFLLSLEQYDRRILCSKMAIVPTSDTKVTGIIDLEFFAVPKINDSDKKYYDWDFKNVYGKDVIFSTGTASGAYATSAEEESASTDKNDFVALLKSPSSEFATFRMGKANDPTLKSFIYDYKNDIVDVTLELTEKDGKFTYKYNAGKYSMPTVGNVAEFTPKSGNIVFKIFSEKRIATDDIAGIKLKVINNTTKTVDVIVDGDDSTNPRVAVSPEGGTVEVK